MEEEQEQEQEEEEEDERFTFRGSIVLSSTRPFTVLYYLSLRFCSLVHT